MAAVPSEELRTVLLMFVIILTANFKFPNRSARSKGPMKRAGKVCGDSQDLKPPGKTQVGAIFTSTRWDISFMPQVVTTNRIM